MLIGGAKKRTFRWTAIPFVRFLAFFSTGILLEVHAQVYHPILLYLEAAICFSYAVLALLFFSKKPYLVLRLGGFLALLSLLLFGIIHTHFYTAHHQTTHFIHEKDEIESYIAIVEAEIQEKTKSFKTEINLSQICVQGQWKKTQGKAILYIEKEKQKINKLRYGDKILVIGSPNLVPNAPNPRQFNYAQYLYYQNIYHLHRTKNQKVIVLDNTPPNYLMQWAIYCREFYKQQFNKMVRTPQEAGLAIALLLGVKDGLDNEVIEAYSNTGTMHVLAVSGMHVSYIFIAIGLLLGFLKNNKKTHWLFPLLSLLILWFYAFVTGLSASVLRAVTMFSFIILSKSLIVNTNFYNVMAISAMVLLLWQPFLLMQIGFLLSYLAVLGIVYYQPLLTQVYTPKNWFMEQAWAIISVSITAQIATVPISLFCFHQFPNYFLLSNLLIIPISAIATYIGLAMMVLFWLPFVNDALGLGMQWFIWLMNQCTFGVEKLPYALWNGIDISVEQTILMYLLLIFATLFFKTNQMYYWVACLVFVFLFSALQLQEVWQQHKQQELIVFNVHQHAVLTYIKSDKALVYSSIDLKKDSPIKKNSILPYFYYKGINKTDYQPINQDTTQNYRILVFQNKKILWIQKPIKYSQWAMFKPFNFDAVLISFNAIPADIAKLQSYYQPKTLILDTSNKPFRAKKFQKEAQKYQIPTFAVADKACVIPF